MGLDFQPVNQPLSGALLNLGTREGLKQYGHFVHKTICRICDIQKLVKGWMTNVETLSSSTVFIY